MKYLNLDGLSNFLTNLRSTFADKDHTHDDVYYTETEIDGKVSGLQADIDGKVAELQADIDGHSHSWSTVSDKPPYMIGKREVLYQGTHQFTENSNGTLSTSTMYSIYDATNEGSLSYYDLVEFVVDKYSIVCSIPEYPNIPLGSVEQGIEYMYQAGIISVNGSLDLKPGKSYNVSINRLPLYPELETWLFDNGYMPYQVIAGSFASKSEMNTAMAKKADKTHTHEISDVKNLQTSLNSLQASIDSIDDSVDNITSGTTVVKEAEHAGSADSATNATNSTNAAHATSADTATSATKATQDGNGKVIADTYETKADATTKLNTAKSYADSVGATVKNDLLNGAGEAYDTLKELGDLINTNVNAIDALESVAANKADKTHSHTITANANDDDIVILEGTNGTNAVTYKATHAASGAAAGSYGDSGNQTPAYGGTFKVPYVTVNATGHVTGISAHTVKIPAAVTLSSLGVTATAAELNKLDGVTATATELNYVDGVTSNVQTQINTLSDVVATKAAVQFVTWEDGD